MNSVIDNHMPSLEEAVSRYLNTYARLYRNYCWTIAACIVSAAVSAGAGLYLTVSGSGTPQGYHLVILVLSAASLLLTWGFLRTTLRVRTALRQLENWVQEDAAC